MTIELTKEQILEIAKRHEVFGLNSQDSREYMIGFIEANIQGRGYHKLGDRDSTWRIGRYKEFIDDIISVNKQIQRINILDSLGI